MRNYRARYDLGPIWNQWVEYTHVLLITEEHVTMHRVWVCDFEGNLVTTIPITGFTVDDICLDPITNTYWTTNEGTGEAANAYNFDLSGTLLTTIQIAAADIIELESVCVAADGTLWTVEDKTNNAKLSHWERAPDGSGVGVQIGATIDLAAAWSMVNLLSIQGITYDFRDDVLWVTNNQDNHIHKVGLDGTKLATLDISGLATGTGVQGLTCDPYEDVLYVAVRNDRILVINKTTGDLIRTISPTPASATGPTGVTIGLFRRDYLGPYVNWKLDENAANTTVKDVTQRLNGNLDSGTTADVSIAGHFGDGAFDFHPSGYKYIDLGAPAEVFGLQKPFTISMWLYFNTISDEMIFGTALDNDYLWIDNTSQVSMKMASTAAAYNFAPYNDAANYFTTGEWQHLFILRGIDGALYFYRNNVTPDNTLASKVWAFNIEYIGKRSTSNFDGSMQQIMIFDRALTAEERAFIYNNGAGRNDMWRGTNRPKEMK